ncbi:hypothetical protein BU25DRAFT_236184 [Macroventuria anomochaeta]|uniref:Uncharacterized protein n=1 Tax=Macroventuria anomochaeta TaxID=301207 RepID=A0ACB6RIW6_9PLEO|nr:uncharacterized protein BU25DRAFT_236184 [Macroventuria anomochaeta]KAF2621632.1 hypothetical protein BU25DRAFT_236184 [Macroventuria anomochaeta]
MRNFAPFQLVAVVFAALCAATPEARPDAEADAAPQITNNAPFSGAVYLVNPNGQQVTAQGTNYCPSSASQSCSSVNAPSWCCPANYACVVPANSNGLLGCCPSGSTCGGYVNAAAISTVTVQAQQYTTYVQQPTSFVIYNAPTTVQGGFCATITMDGPGLPRAAEGQCGTILLVAEGVSLKIIGVGAGVTAVLLHIALGRMFR